MSTAAPVRRGAASGERYREAIGHQAEAVAVVTTSFGAETFGTTAEAVASLSNEPPMLLVCLERDSATGRAIDRSGEFVVNFLTEDQIHLAEVFAHDGRNGGSGSAAADRVPLLDDCLAQIECQVTERVTSATHIVFIGVAQSVEVSGGSPHASYRGRFSRLELIDGGA